MSTGPGCRDWSHRPRSLNASIGSNGSQTKREQSRAHAIGQRGVGQRGLSCGDVHGSFLGNEESRTQPACLRFCVRVPIPCPEIADSAPWRMEQPRDLCRKPALSKSSSNANACSMPCPRMSSKLTRSTRETPEDAASRADRARSCRSGPTHVTSMTGIRSSASRRTASSPRRRWVRAKASTTTYECVIRCSSAAAPANAPTTASVSLAS